MKKKYLLSGLIVFIVLMGVYFIKHIYPFGSDFIAWGDMHSQILALYYNFYDIFHSGKSLLIGFSSLTAVNLVANFTYYAMSPITFIILLFQRCDIPQAVSLIVLIKMVLASITCSYFLDKVFPKLHGFYNIVFGVLYGLSTYNLSLYIISSWMDVVVLFPLLMLGLYRLLKDGKVTLYIVILTLCLLFNFYTAVLSTIFVFFISFIYLYMYQKGSIKKSLTLLGFSTVLPVVMSTILLLPTFLQLLNSTRIGFSFSDLLQVKTGPLIDKFMFLTSSCAAIACLVLMLKRLKGDKKWLRFFIISVLLVTLSLVIEPINKMWHLGSYMYYPYRYGFITTLLLIFGAAYFLTKDTTNVKETKLSKILPIVTTIICNIGIVFLTYKYYNIIQASINHLTFTRNHFSFYIMVIIAILSFVNYFVIFKFNTKKMIYFVCLGLSIFVFTFTQSLLYIKIDSDEKMLHQMYSDLNYIYEQEYDDGYHFKKNQAILFENYGYVIDKPVNDFFTSLIDNSMYTNLQKLGYDAYAMNTSSSGSNIFIDNLLAQKYIISEQELDNRYYKLIDTTNELKIYETIIPVGKAYLLNDNVELSDDNNSFENTNKIYQALTNSNENIITYKNTWEEVNITRKDNSIKITNKDDEAYFKTTIHADGEQLLYLEIGKSLLNNAKTKFFETLDIYVNNELVINKYPSEDYNGSIYLGTFNDEDIEVKIVVLENSIGIEDLRIGLLDYNKLTNYYDNAIINADISYNKNNINIKYNSDSESIIFIPIQYLKGMSAKNNGSDTDIIQVFDTFIGIKLNKGENNINISYTTPGLKIGLIVTIVGLILTIVFIKIKDKITAIKWLNNTIFIIYVILYIILVLLYFIIPMGIFLLIW